MPDCSGHSIKLTAIPADNLDEVWPEVEPMLKKATDRADDYEPRDLYEFLLKEFYQLWVAFNDERILAACTTTITTYPRKRVLSMTHIGGTGMRDWLRFEPVLIQFAKDNGCSAIEGYARPGWLKVLKDWKPDQIRIRKAV